MKNYYEIFELDSNCNIDEIKKKYREFALLFHPDRNPNSKIKFEEILEGYEILSNEEKRKKFDRELKFYEKELKLLDGQISEQVPLSEMDLESDNFISNCRCSGKYIISLSDLENGFSIVQCSSCSLKIKIIF